MEKILIIGGGLSGFSSALFLSNAGYSVELIEASPKLGGRVYSFEYNSQRVDNGQHILMECYTNTFEYIDLIGARKFFAFQDSLSINYVDDKRKTTTFKIPKYFYPLNNIIGLMNFKVLKIKDRFAVLKLLLKIKRTDTAKYKDKTVYEYLLQNKQSESIIRKFWEGVVLSTMNTPTEVASSKMFIDMLKIIFFSNKRGANIVIPKVDLNTALINPAIEKLNSNGVAISTSERVRSFFSREDKIIAVETSKRIIDDFDILISAIPENSLRKITIKNSAKKIHIPELDYSSIVTVHVWLSKNPFTERMYNLIGGEFDWLFNHGTHISLLKSSAKKLATMDKKAVKLMLSSELKKYFTILSNIEIEDYVVLKEVNATFIPNLDSLKKRSSISNPFSNLFIIGDWAENNLPATIEGAVKSGKDISEKIIRNLE